jgi:hypothetical protein
MFSRAQKVCEVFTSAFKRQLLMIPPQGGIDAQGSGTDRSFAARVSKRAQAGLAAKRAHFARRGRL